MRQNLYQTPERDHVHKPLRQAVGEGAFLTANPLRLSKPPEARRCRSERIEAPRHPERTRSPYKRPAKAAGRRPLRPEYPAGWESPRSSTRTSARMAWIGNATIVCRTIDHQENGFLKQLLQGSRRSGTPADVSCGGSHCLCIVSFFARSLDHRFGAGAAPFGSASRASRANPSRVTRTVGPQAAALAGHGRLSSAG